MRKEIKFGVTYSLRAAIVYQIVQGMAKLELFKDYYLTTTFCTSHYDINGLEGAAKLDSGEFDLVFLNPSPIGNMAVKGMGPYDRKIELRALAVFPSWDRLVVVAKKSLGISSLREIVERKIPIKLSIRKQGPGGSTAFATKCILDYYGAKIADIEKWGGRVDPVPYPNDPKRLNGLTEKRYDVVIDEGISAWIPSALQNGMTVLPLEDELYESLDRLGFKKLQIPKGKYGVSEDVPAVEFGGWLLCCRAILPDDVTYNITKAIDLQQDVIPTDDGTKLDMSRICKNTEEGPLSVRLHPGAEKYYVEHGYL